MVASSGNRVRSWLVLLAACLSVFLYGGLTHSYGTILLDVQEEFDVSTSFIGLVFSLTFALLFFVSPINTTLHKRFSMRQVTVVGGLIAGAGLCLSSLTRTAGVFAAVLSLYGIGFSPVYLACFSVAAHYFPRSFSIVSGVIASAGGMGIMILPHVTKVFRDIYGWRGALLLTGALNLHVVVFGALLTDRKGKRDTIDHIDKEAKIGEHPGDIEIVIVNQGAEVVETIDIPQDTAKAAHDAVSRDASSTTTGKYCGVVSCDKETISSCPNPTEEKPYIELPSTPEYNRQTSDRTQSAEILSTSTAVEKYDASSCFNLCQCLIKGILQEFDLHLFHDFPITIGILSLIFFAFAIIFAVWSFFIIPNALAKDLALDQAVFLTTTGGITNIVGRLLAGVLASKQFIRNEALYFTALFSSGFAFFVNYAATSMWFLGILSAVNGLSVGFKTTMVFVLVQAKLPSTRYKGALSLLFTMSGVGLMVGGPIAGKLFDATGSYNITFCIAGAIELGLGLPLALLARQADFSPT